MRKEFDLEQLFKNYKNKIYWLSLRIVHNEKDAEDVVQNTFIKIIKNIKGFKGMSSLSTWIYKITYNEALMFLRRKYRQGKFSANIREYGRLSALNFDGTSRPNKELENNEFKERLDNAIKRIPLKYRISILLHSVENLSLKESADIMGIKINSLKTRLHRAFGLLREEVTDYIKDGKEGNIQTAKCSTHMKFIYDYASGRLNKKEYTAFHNHIKDCSSCEEFLSIYSKAISVTKALQCQDLPAELEAKIESFLRIGKRGFSQI